jgi:hypothetical protein
MRVSEDPNESRDPAEFPDPAGRQDPAGLQDPYSGSDRTAEVIPPPAMAFSAWDYRPDAGWAPEFDLVGYHVEAVDGSVGKVNVATHATDNSYLVVDTGPWIFGRTVVIPAGIVTHIDHTDRRIYLDRDKEQVKASPDYSDEPGFRDKLAGHYGGGPR